MTLEVERIETFRTGFGGVLLLPDDDEYELARAVHNGLIDRRPGLIARCHGTAMSSRRWRSQRSRGWRWPSEAVVTTSPVARCAMTAS